MIKIKLTVLLLKIIAFLNKKQKNAFLSVFIMDNKKGTYACSVIGKRLDIANMLCQVFSVEPDIVDAITQYGQVSTFDNEILKDYIDKVHIFEQKFLM